MTDTWRSVLSRTNLRMFNLLNYAAMPCGIMVKMALMTCPHIKRQ